MDRPIRIFIDAHTYDQIFEGTRTYISGLYRALLRKYPKEVVCSFGAVNTVNLKTDFGEFENSRFVRYKYKSKMARMCFEFSRILKKQDYDFAHFQYVTPLFKTTKFIVTIHDLLFNDFPKEFPLAYRLSRNLFFHKSALQSDIITTVSNYSANSLIKNYKISAKKINIISSGLNADSSVIANGINDMFFQDFDKNESVNYIQKRFGIANYILNVSRVEPRKKQSMILRTYLNKKLFEKGISLVFVGKHAIGSSDFDDLMKHLPEEAKHFVFHFEQVTQEELIHFYRAARFFIYPSIAEGFGVPPLEAVASKVPTICSNQTALSDFTFFGKYFFDPNDENEFNEKFDDLLDNEKEAREYFSSPSVLGAIKKYSFDKSAEKFYELLKENLTK
ncbi:MAG: glycosyltransferase family 4 protein [Bacteroidia bacterium]